MKITGKVVYEELEGGFWGIEGDDGQNYKPIEGFPEEAKKAGQTIEAEADFVEVMGISMWGRTIKIHSLSVK